MKNSLRRLRKQKRLSLRSAGDGMGIPFQTLANYEKSQNPLAEDVLAKAAKFYDVSETEVAEEDNSVHEDAVPYYTGSISLDIMPDGMLVAMERALAPRIVGSSGAQRAKIIAGLTELGLAMERRGIKHGAQGGPSSNLTSEQEALAAGAMELAERERGEPGGKPPPSGVGAPGGSKPARSAPSSPATRAERPVTGAKVQK